MKNIISITLFLLFVVTAYAQEVQPKFEKQAGLTKATYYYGNGAVKEVGFFKDNKLHNKWVSYSKEGDITTIAMYNNGKKDGKWYVIVNDSIKELTYKSNKLIKIETVKGTELSYI